MILDRHWWRTADERLVPDGHPDAAFLAYPKGHEIPDHLAERLGLVAAVRAFTQTDDAVPDLGEGDEGDDEGEPTLTKAADKPEDKMAAKPADKAARPGERRNTAAPDTAA